MPPSGLPLADDDRLLAKRDLGFDEREIGKHIADDDTQAVQQGELVRAQHLRIGRAQRRRVGEIVLLLHAGGEIGEGAAMASPGDHLDAVAAGDVEPLFFRAHPVEGDRPGMGGAHVLAVADEVERADLPVGPGAPAMRRREDLHPLRRAPEQRVEIPRDVAEMVAQRRHARIPCGEDEAPVGLHFRRRDQPPARLVHFGRQMLVIAGGDEAAVGLVAPAVIGADEMPGRCRNPRGTAWCRDGGRS